MSKLISLTKKEEMYTLGAYGTMRKIIFGNSVMTLKYKTEYEQPHCIIYIKCSTSIELILTFIANDCCNDFFKHSQTVTLLAKKDHRFAYALTSVISDFSLKLECSTYNQFGTVPCSEFGIQEISWIRKGKKLVLGKKEWMGEDVKLLLGKKVKHVSHRPTQSQDARKKNEVDQKQETWHDYFPHLVEMKNAVFEKELKNLEEDLNFLKTKTVKEEEEMVLALDEKMSDDMEHVWEETDISDATLREKFEFVEPLFSLKLKHHDIDDIDSIDFE